MIKNIMYSYLVYSKKYCKYVVHGLKNGWMNILTAIIINFNCKFVMIINNYC